MASEKLRSNSVKRHVSWWLKKESEAPKTIGHCCSLNQCFVTYSGEEIDSFSRALVGNTVAQEIRRSSSPTLLNFFPLVISLSEWSNHQSDVGLYQRSTLRGHHKRVNASE